MSLNFERENENIFAECKKICQDCKFCSQKCANSAQIDTKDKSVEYSYDKKMGKVCPVCKALLDFAKTNEFYVDTQFLRVKFYHDLADFLGDICSCNHIAPVVCDRIDETWARTLLFVFPAVHNLLEILSSTVDGYALARTKAFGLNDMMEDTYSQAETMLRMIARQGPLGELAKRLDVAFELLDDDLKDVAKMRFFEQKTTRETAKKLQICSRTVQRRVDRLVKNFVEICYEVNINFDWVLEEVGVNEAWLLDWFRL